MTEATTETQGLPPINLHANSYDLQELIAASKHAEGLSTDKGQDKAFAAIPDKLAANQGVLEGKLGIAVPEHHKLEKILDAQGNEVHAPVPVIGEEASEAAAEAEQQAENLTSNNRRRGQAEPNDVVTDKTS